MKKLSIFRPLFRQNLTSGCILAIPFTHEKEYVARTKIHTICELCKTMIKHTGNTNNIRSHLARHHPGASTGVEKPTVVKVEPTTIYQRTQIKPESASEPPMELPKPISQPSISSVFKDQAKYHVSLSHP